MMNTPNWPNLFIVGAVKSGTTSLHAWLSQHPDVFMSAIKEPHYFAQITQTEQHRNFEPVISEERDYLALFNKVTTQSVIGEASPSYLFTVDAARRIQHICPDARIVIALRDPVERAFSHYLMEYRAGREQRDFDDALQADANNPNRHWGQAFLYEDLGMYSTQVARYLDTFGRDRVHIILFDDISAQPHAEMNAVCDFLSIERCELNASNSMTAHNVYEQPRSEWARKLNRHALLRTSAKKWLPRSVRHWFRNQFMFTRGDKPVMSETARQRLQTRYDPDISALEERLKTPLPALRRTWHSA